MNVFDILLQIFGIGVFLIGTLSGFIISFALLLRWRENRNRGR